MSEPNGFARHYARVLRYSASEGGAAYLLSRESLTDHDRWGGKKADHTKRGVIADYLQDLGRDAEAELLRSGRHVVVDGGVVRPGRWTLRPLHQLRRQFTRELRDAGDWDAAHPPGMNGYGETPESVTPSAAFVGRDEDDPRLYSEDATAHTGRVDLHHDDESGLPLVGGSTFTCHDFECGVHEAGREWGELLADTLFDPRNHVVDHIPADRRRELEDSIRRRSAALSLEEPEP